MQSRRFAEDIAEEVGFKMTISMSLEGVWGPLRVLNNLGSLCGNRESFWMSGPNWLSV